MGRMTPPVVTLPGTAMQSGTIVLPAGSPLTLASLTVKNSLSLAQPSASGTFALPQFTGGPQFAFVTNPAGDAILAGFVGPQSTTIDATSTAKVFIYWSAGFFLLPSPYRAQVVDALPTEPGFAAVVTAFQNSLTSSQDPFQFAMGRMAIVQAIQTFTQSIYTSSRRSTPLGRVLRAAQSARHISAVPAPGITPATAQSGITATLDGSSGFHLTNTYRRLAQAFIDEDSFVDSTGTRQPKHVTDAVAPQRVSSVSGLGNVTGGPITVALQLLGGGTPYTPVSTPTIALPIEPGSTTTRYIVTVVGGGQPNSNVTLTEEQSAAQQSIVVQQLVQDYLVPLVASITIPINSTQLDDYFASDGGGAAMATIVASIDAAAPQILPVASSGQIGDALLLGMQAVAPNPALQTQLLTLVGKLISATAGSEAAAAFQNGFSPLYGLNVLSAVINSNDTAVATANITASNIADVFVVDVGLNGSVSLSPATANVAAGTQVTFTATAGAPGAGQTIVYDWTNTGNFGHTTDGTTGHTDTFESASNTVTYTASASGNGSDTITVTAFAVQGSTRTQIGSTASANANAGKCPFGGTFSGPLTDGRFTPALVSTYNLTVTCSPPNIVHSAWTDVSYGSGSFDSIAVGHTVSQPGNPNGPVEVFSADYNTINGTELDAKQTDVLTRTSGP